MSMSDGSAYNKQEYPKSQVNDQSRKIKKENYKDSPIL